MQTTPRGELEARLVRLQSRLHQRGLDGAFFLQKADLFYLTGTVQNGIFYVPAQGKPLFAVRRSLQRARAESAWEEILPLRGIKTLPGLLAGRGLAAPARLGLEPDVLPAAIYLQFAEAFPGAALEDASEALPAVRMVKSVYEVERVERAAGQLCAVFAAIPGMIRDGCGREIELAASIESFLRRERHQGIVRTRRFGMEMYFGSVSAGGTASHPTDFDGPVGVEGLYPAAPQSGGERPLRAGEPIVIDLCGGYGGYTADMTRVFALGGLQDEELLRAHRFALEIQEMVRERMRPGAVTGAIYREVEERVLDSPFAGQFMGHGDNRSAFVGHGLGIELDELPVFAARSEVPLREGMVVAIEPKFFFGERGGVGIENTWVITAEGCRCLTASDDAIVVV